MYQFIINPHSRSGKGLEIWQQLKPILADRQVVYEAYFTKYQKHAVSIAQHLTDNSDTHVIIVLGGDGTVNEVISGITNYANVTLGYIPSGSSNDFARGLNLPSDPLLALNTILSPHHLRFINIGLLTHGHGEKQTCFAVSTGIGFDAAVCHEAAVSRLKSFLNKFNLGSLTYAGIALRNVFFCNPSPLSLTLDGQIHKQFEKAYFSAVMNFPYEGGGIQFCPNAVPDDGYLDVIVVSDLPKWKILFLLAAAFKGKHTHSKSVHIYRCKTVSIDSARALPVHTDGEPVFPQTHVAVSCCPGRLRVIAGSSLQKGN